MEIWMALPPPGWTDYDRHQKKMTEWRVCGQRTHTMTSEVVKYTSTSEGLKIHSIILNERNLGWSLGGPAAVSQNIVLWFERRWVEKVTGRWTMGRGKDLSGWPSGQGMPSTFHPGKGSLRSTGPICSRRGKWHIIGSRPDKGSVYITLPDTGLTGASLPTSLRPSEREREERARATWFLTPATHWGYFSLQVRLTLHHQLPITQLAYLFLHPRWTFSALGTCEI